MTIKRTKNIIESDNSSDFINKNCKLDLDSDFYINEESKEKMEFNVNDNLKNGICDICNRIAKKSNVILTDNEKSSMVQTSWLNLINNFNIIFIPRLLSKPYEIKCHSEKNKLIEKILFENNLIENKRLSEIDIENNKKKIEENKNLNYTLFCLHPSVYSKNIENLSIIGSKNTNISILDDMLDMLHKKELILCQKYIEPIHTGIGNLYEFEINSLVWGINGIIYHAGDDNRNNINNVNSYFNLTYYPPELYLPISNTPLIFIKELNQLKDMIDEILNSVEIHYKKTDNPFLLAIDVEHHSNQSFKGFVSLIQLSTRTHDYIIDPFNIFQDLHILNDLTANPKILKILHGSDYDVIWLQRDFSVYIVNMFDTGQAARVLNTPGGYSLKNILNIYCSIDVDKKFQLADWRERPLTNELIEYARSDTHYLLYVYEIMKNLLLLQGHKKYESSTIVSDAFLNIENNCILLNDDILERYSFNNIDNNNNNNNNNNNVDNNNNNMHVNNGINNKLTSINIPDLNPSPLLTVLHNSRLICLKYYTEKPINIWNICYNIKTKVPKSNLKTPIDNAIVTLISYSLILWRESLSRILDVNINYILKDYTITKLCQKQPLNTKELFNLYSNIPTNVKRYSEYILTIINDIKTFILSKSEDEIFNFNSYISHIYSNLINDLEYDSFNKQPKNNHNLFIFDIPNKDNINDVDNINNSKIQDKDKIDNGKVSENEIKNINLNKPKKIVSIKKISNEDDYFANNLFGNKTQNYNSSENLISKEIRKEIINTLNGNISNIFNFEYNNDQNLINKNNENTIITQFNDKNNEKLINEEQINKFIKDDFKLDDMKDKNISEKDKTEEINENCNVDIKSIKEKYTESNDYINKKSKIRKLDQLNNNMHVDNNINNMHVNNGINKNKNKNNNNNNKINKIPDIIRDNVKILPASILSSDHIPDFIKKSTENSIIKKSKKFISSMKTKKWHKK